VSVGSDLAASAKKRDAAAREVERVTLEIEDHFDVLLVKRFLRRKRRRRGDDLDLRTVSQLSRKALQKNRVNQWFIALDIENDRGLFQLSRNLSNAVGPGGMICSRDGNFCAEVKSGFRDSHVIGRNNNLIKAARFDTSLPNVSDQRLAGDAVEGLPGKSG
jgi:hypothetical protein